MKGVDELLGETLEVTNCDFKNDCRFLCCYILNLWHNKRQQDLRRFRKMDRKKYWLVLWNPAFIALYGYGLSVVYEFCRFGGMRRRLPVIAGLGLAGLAWLVIWTILYFCLKKRKAGDGAAAKAPLQKERKKKKGTAAAVVLAAEALALLIVTGVYGYRIYLTAAPYSGKLGSYIQQKQSSRTVRLGEQDFSENGLDGVFEALSKKCGLDADMELYTVNTVSFTVDGNGILKTLDAFFYGYDEDGEFHSWLIGYDVSESSRMTVYLDGYANSEYKEQQQLSPMRSMIAAFLEEQEEDGWDSSVTYTFRYGGYAEGAYDASDQWLRLGEDGALEEYDPSAYGNTNEGFLLTVYAEEERILTLITGEGTMETKASLQEQEKQEAEEAAKENQIEEAQEAGGTLFRENDDLTFYLNEAVSMSLAVVDAAAGSRCYVFRNGEIYNGTPFEDHWGVAESIYFLDEDTGFILLTNASWNSSLMYYTADGGETFTQIVLPTEEGAEEMEENEFGFTTEDMNYIDTPYETNGILYVRVGADASGIDEQSLIFRSKDRGQTWEYLSFSY